MGSSMTSPTIRTNLTTVFVANNSSNNLLACTSGDAVHWSGNVLVSGQKSGQSPSVAAFKDKLWAAFISDNSHRELLICSSTDGKSWTANTRVNQSSKAAPSLCVFNGKLWLAFIANDSSSRILVCSSNDGLSWSDNSPVGQTSPLPPSLCVFNGKLWLAFVANDSSKRLLICSSGDGGNWSGYSEVGQTSKEGPGLCAFKGKLWLAFLANNDSNEILITGSSDGTHWSGNTRCNQASKSGPSLTALNDTMYLGFISNNDKEEVLICTSSDGTNFSGNQKIGQASKTRPTFFAQQFKVGTLRPKYQVMTVVYAPPGTAGGASTSQVVYSSSSSAGTTSSISKSLNKSLSVSATVGDESAVSGSASFSASRTETDTSSIDIQKSHSFDLTVGGPAEDGINHELDQIWLCLNPLYTITADNWSNVSWAMGVDGSEMRIQYVYVGWLKNPSKMPSNVRATLDKAGLTTDDYAQLLSTHPFASGTTIDKNRYMGTGQSFPYNPPYGPDYTVPVQTYTQENSITVSESRTVEVQYGVSVKMTQGIEGVFSLEQTASMQWTNTNTTGSSSSKSQSASVSVGGPSYGYTGPTDVLVYWDTVYNTFMFAFPQDEPASTGLVQDASGKAVAQAEVKLTVGNTTLKTYTDASGNYRFYDVPSGQAKVTAGGQSHTVAVGKGSTKAMIKLS